MLAGIAVDKYGLMYFVDATMIRKVDQNGIISTLLGSNDLTAVRPLSCDSSMDVTQVECYLLLIIKQMDKCLVVTSKIHQKFQHAGRKSYC